MYRWVIPLAKYDSNVICLIQYVQKTIVGGLEPPTLTLHAICIASSLFSLGGNSGISTGVLGNNITTRAREKQVRPKGSPSVYCVFIKEMLSF